MGGKRGGLGIEFKGMECGREGIIWEEGHQAIHRKTRGREIIGKIAFFV